MRSLLQPTKRRRVVRVTVNWKSGSIGWIGLATYVATWDLLAWAWQGETLTGSFGRGRRHPYLRAAVYGSWAITTLHLFGCLPERYDPYLRVARLLPARGLVDNNLLFREISGPVLAIG